MKTTAIPVVPESLRPYATDDFYAEVEQYKSQDLASITATMPDYAWFNRYKDNEPATAVALYCPAEYNPKHAVFHFYPFANGHSPSMHIRTQLMQRVLGNNMQVVAFPNNTVDAQFYGMSESDQATVAAGDARPLAVGILGVAKALRLESFDIVGYSQGAFVGAAVLQLATQRGEMEIQHVLLGEPPTVEKTTPAELKKAFMQTGMLPLIRAVKQSAIPALTEAQGMRGLRDARKLCAGLLGVQKSSKLPINQALHNGMTHGNLVDVLDSIGYYGYEADLPALTVARAENSSVTPLCFDYEHAANTMADREITLEGYGHEAADNISGVFALLVKSALTTQRLAA